MQLFLNLIYEGPSCSARGSGAAARSGSRPPAQERARAGEQTARDELPSAKVVTNQYGMIGRSGGL